MKTPTNQTAEQAGQAGPAVPAEQSEPAGPEFTLRCTDPDAEAPLLRRVDAAGRLDGVLFTMTLRQTWRNGSGRNLEALYSFPLPPQAVLLGFAAVFGDRRLQGTVMPRAQAERTYEDALAEGHAPVLLEVAADGLHTASLGNLLPGEELVLELRFAQLLAFEQGRLRLVVPTTIAPRYGSASAAGVPAHQVPAVSLTAEYPLALSITVAGSLAGARIDCPTHPHRLRALTAGAGGDEGPGRSGHGAHGRPAGALTELVLAEGARLDRDVVVLLTPREPRPDLLVTGRDADGQVVALAAFEPPAAPARSRVSLALLVDCSGSMGGDSIASARRALQAVAAALGPADRVSYTRFGSTAQHELRPAPCSAAVAAALQRRVAASDADLGGTEMAAALQAVFGLWQAEGGADLLLLTDGEVWAADALVDAARAGGHRVFAIGVGSAPAEGVLRRLAEATGGACEFATPGEALEAAAARMLARIRQQPCTRLRVDWGIAPGAGPMWELLPGAVFGGDTVLAWAGLARELPPQAVVRLLARGADGTEAELARSCVRVAAEGSDLARIAAACRLPAMAPEPALQLALAQQLLTQQTDCVLVHQRADADKPAQQAELQRVASMLAAGWGGTGKVSAVVTYSLSAISMVGPAFVTPSVWRSGRTASEKVEALTSGGMDETEIPAFLRKPHAEERPMTLGEIARGVTDYVRRRSDMAGLPSHCRQWSLPAPVQRLLDELVRIGIDEAQVWLALAAWVAQRADAGTGVGTDAGGKAAIELSCLAGLSTLDAQAAELVHDALQRHLGAVSLNGWASRGERLAQRLREREAARRRVP